MEQATLVANGFANKQVLKFKKLQADVELPKQGSEFSLGFDLYLPEDIEIAPSEYGVNVPLKIAYEPPVGYGAMLALRSSTGYYTTLRMSNAVGIIDEDYRGEISLLLDNIGEYPVHLTKGERIAQLVLLPLPRVEVVEVQEINDTSRGSGRFGSTGR